MQQARVRPFLKWVGGKYRVLELLYPHLKGRKLIEPFVGAGSVFLNLNFKRYLLGDINSDLINLYQCLQKDKIQFIDYLRPFFQSKSNNRYFFLEARQEFNSGLTGRRRAAIFVYLNRHGFNGLCRYNKSGGFNVPFGQYSQPYFPEKEMLHFIQHAKNATFVCDDFVSLMNRSRRGDVVYCDPPYVPMSSTANFTKYSIDGFTEEQQLLLATRARKLADRGVKVIISNHDNEVTRELYSGATIQTFLVQRNISRDGSNRGQAKELLAIFE